MNPATWLLGTGGLIVYTLAVLACVRTLARGRGMAVVLAAALLLPRSYTPFAIISAGESLAIPRPWAEAFVLFAIACLAARRPVAAFALVGAAAVFHPIMAVPGALLLLLAICRSDRRWVPLFASGALALTIAAALGAPIVSRIFVRIDPTWLAILRTRNAYLFVTTWNVDVWCQIAVQVATVLLALRLVPPVWRTVLVGTLCVALLGCLASFVGVDLLSSLLMAQVQLWRSLWLLAALAPVAAGVCLVSLSREGWRGRAVLVALAAAWATPSLAPANAMMALLALFLAYRDDQGVDTRVHKGACGAAIVLVLFVLASNVRLATAYLAVLPSDMRMTTFDIVRLSMAAFVVIGIVVWTATTRRRTLRLPVAASLLAAMLLGMVRYDDRRAAKADIDSAVVRADLVAMLASRPGEVLWLGDSAVWSWARRPAWNDRYQGGGLVFSRALALQWFERTRALVDLDFADDNLLDPWKPGVVHRTPTYDATAIAALCRRDDAPAWIVMPIADGSPAPPGVAIWSPRLDERLVVVEGDAFVVRSASRRLVVPCRSTAH